MFSQVFLAATAQEQVKQPPKRFAYLALHFSPYGKGLSNIPTDLPKGSIILLDDSTPPQQHSPKLVVPQLTDIMNQFCPAAVLLDFQRSVTSSAMDMAKQIAQALPCPVGMTEGYAKDLGYPVFLPPLSANKGLAEFIAPWKKAGVFLEIAPVGVEITVTENESNTRPIPITPDLPLKNEQLHCHYSTEVLSDKAVFTICRYKEDLAALVTEAEHLGVLGCVGLYNELI